MKTTEVPEAAAPADCPATLPFGDLRGFSPLFRAYTSDFRPLAPFYAHPPFSPDALHDAARRAAQHVQHRDTLARVLLRQNERWSAEGAPLDEKVRRNIERLARPGTAAVVTGQQLGLFTGPIYTVYKTLTAIALAARLTAEGQPAVPVFWLHGEDHDFDEIAGATLLDGDTPVTIRYDHPMPANGNAGPVGRLVLTDAIRPALDAFENALPDTRDRARLMDALRQAYAPGTTLTDAFARFARTLFPDTGLVFIDPDDAELKRLLVPLFQHDARASADVTREVEGASTRLVDAGFHAQVHVTPTNLFMLTPAGRLAVDAEGDGYTVRGTGRTYTQPELLDEIAAQPEAFSPNVLLRPLAQDTLLPTAAYVAGPGEIAYYAQFGPAYQAAAVPMPVIYPRASATLVEPRVQQLMARHGLAPADLDARPDMAFQRVVARRMDGRLQTALDDFAGALQAAVDAVAPLLTGLDGSLAASAGATRTRLAKEAARLGTRALRAEKRRQQDLAHAMARIGAHLFPGEKPQERVLTVGYFLAHYGWDLPRRLLETLPLDTSAHAIVSVEAPPAL